MGKDFSDVCLDMGLDNVDAKWLFKVLDTDRHRVITEHTNIKFLYHWDPGYVQGMTLQDLAKASYTPAHKKEQSQSNAEELQPRDEKAAGPFAFSRSKPFEIILQLTKTEHEEYLRRLRSHMLRAGVPPGITSLYQPKKRKDDGTVQEEESENVEESRLDSRGVGIADAALASMQTRLDKLTAWAAQSQPA